jgi:RNA polymerase sigma-70 factor (sigma-E family)
MSNDAGRRAFDDFARAVRAPLHRDAYRLCGDWHEAEDLVQDVLWRLYRRWSLLADHDRLSRYSRQTLLRTFVQEHRRAHRRFEVLLSPPPDGNASAPNVEERIVLRDALSRLGPRQRAVVVSRFLLDRSVGHTAARLGCTAGTVTSQTHRALTRLRAELLA